jgi:hypothetical protein
MLHILQHSLGVDKFGQGRQYRNHFCTGPGSKDYDDCKSLVAAGLMAEHPGSELTGGDNLFTVTPAGIDYVALHSPPVPPEQKLTRSQRRYRQYLASNCDWSFAEWLGIR